MCKPKKDVTVNIDKACRELCPDRLDFFVTFSSVTSGRGRNGLSNYALANSSMEKVCMKRFSDGLAGESVRYYPFPADTRR